MTPFVTTAGTPTGAAFRRVVIQPVPRALTMSVAVTRADGKRMLRERVVLRRRAASRGVAAAAGALPGAAARRRARDDVHHAGRPSFHTALTSGTPGR